eukprot:scaffold284688_cov13-Tisochrysis_lutea.AAC.1
MERGAGASREVLSFFSVKLLKRKQAMQVQSLEHKSKLLTTFKGQAQRQRLLVSLPRHWKTSVQKILRYHSIMLSHSTLTMPS